MPSKWPDTLEMVWQPRQRELWNLFEDGSHTMNGFGGSRGGGKSHSGRQVIIARRLKYPNTNALIFRKTYKDLYENHIEPMFYAFPFMRDSYNESKKTLFFPNGSRIVFGYAEHHDDIFAFFGQGYADILIDEATDLEQDQIEFLRTCNRCTTNTDIVPKMLLTMNPGRIGHAYIKRIFIDRRYDNNENPKDYAFIQAYGWDNVEWCRQALLRDKTTVSRYYSWPSEKRLQYFVENSNYGRILNAMKPDDRKAHLLGDWDTFAGMFFKTFQRKAMVQPPFEIPAEWELVGSLDPGYSSPMSFGLVAQDFDGHYYRVATYYESERTPIDHARAIREFIQTCPWTGGRMPSRIVAGHDAWAKRDRYSVIATEKVMADIFLDEGLLLTKAITDRKQGWWALKSLMPDRLTIFDGLNEPLVEQLANVVADDKHVEDIKGKGNDPNVEDHALDEIRYNIMASFKPLEQRKEAPPKTYDEYMDREFEKIKAKHIQPKRTAESY